MRIFQIFSKTACVLFRFDRRYLFCLRSVSSKMSLTKLIFPWDFKLSPEDLRKRADNLILKTKAAYDMVESSPLEENFLKDLAGIECSFDTELYYCHFMQYVALDKDLRDTSSEVEKKLLDFTLEVNMRKGLFQKLKAFEDKQLKLPPQTARYLSRLMRRRKRIGMHLSQETQNEIKALQDQIGELRSQFNKNLSNNNTFVEFTREELFGLDDDFINNLDKNPDTQRRKVTMKHPDYIPIMQKAKNPETRKKLYFIYYSRVKENVPILEKLGTLRHKLAKLLGYNTFSDYAAEIHMTKSAANIEKFLMDLSKKVLPLWEQEKKYLLELKKEECKNENLSFDEKLNSWDIGYYLKKSTEKKYSINHDEVKEYFPFQFVMKAVFNIYQKLFNLTFQKVENIETYCSDIETYSVMDNETQELLGYFFMDLYPRDGKYGHYQIQEMQPGCLNSHGARQVASVGLMGNFPKSTATKPALLLHSEVKTFFHEFGHAMHYICNRAEYAEFSCTRVENDFVEAPSQMLENWCWVPEILKMVSSHYVTGDPLSDDLIATLIKSKNANVGHHNLRQISLSLIDQKLHTVEKLDTAKALSDIVGKLMGLETMEGTNFCASFEHIVNGYPAGYYSYLWSEVFCYDMFESRFGQKGVLDPNLGKEYRKKILEPGGSKDAMDLLRDFLGREPNQNAFLRCKGLPVDEN